MDLFGLPFEHPEFPLRVALTIETCLAFITAGGGHGLYSVACAALLPPQMMSTNLSSHNDQLQLFIIIIINATGLYLSFSSNVSRDFRLHYGFSPSTRRLVFLELLRLAGFFVTRRILLPRAGIFTAPLLHFTSEPHSIAANLYTFFVLWAVWMITPELAVISSRLYVLPKFLSRLVGNFLEVMMEDLRKEMAQNVLEQRASDGQDAKPMYEYTPIRTPRTIRLLQIDCRKETLCTLEETNLDEAPPFCAVSYLWGSEEKPKLLAITTRSLAEKRYIPITANCASAIQSLMPFSVRHLWIDAICINQADISEKEFQIPLMGEIYSKAELVVGHLQTDSRFPVSTLIHRILQSAANGTYLKLNFGMEWRATRALADVFAHQYFQRAWILQEMALADRLVLLHGNSCIRLEHLISISNGPVKEKSLLPGNFVNPTWHVPRMYAGVGSSVGRDDFIHFSLVAATFGERAAVLEKIRHSLADRDGSQRLTIAEIVDQNLLLECREPRDQIYAFLSLAADANIPELQPNYDYNSVSDKDIYTRISVHYLREGRYLNLFLSSGVAAEICKQDRSRTPGLPSWAYDFARGPVSAFRRGNCWADLERSRPAGLECEVSPDLMSLSVKGTVIDSIAHSTPQPNFFADMTVESCLRRVWDDLQLFAVKRHAWALAQEHVPDPYPGSGNGMSREEAFWRTLLMDRFEGVTPCRREAEEALNIFEELCAHVIHAMREDPADLSRDFKARARQLLGENLTSLFNMLTRVWMPYTFVVTTQGYMGWALHGVRAGDTFVLLERCVVPFVLRRKEMEGEGADERFELLGDGYVHGFLPGQHMSVEETEKRWFKLV